MIMISLIMYYLSYQGIKSRLFIFGLITALLGDCFLLGEKEIFFFLGLSSFLVMQVVYTTVFYRQGLRYSHRSLFISVIVLGISLLLFSTLIPSLGTLLFPVLIYTLSILIMATMAIFNQSQKGYTYLLLGAVLFVSSDLCLAYNLFDQTLSGSTNTLLSVYVMGSYALAQAFIVKSVLMINRRIS